MRGLPAAGSFLSTLLLATLLTGQAPPPQNVQAHRTIATGNAEAQRDFDEGLTLLYAFNPEEARRRFERAAAADPGAAMPYWGIAMTWGVNLNVSYDPASQRQGHVAIAKAKALEASATPAERALIDAADVRFARSGKNDGDASADAYVDAMLHAAQRLPDDDDVQVLTAEAEMDATPWDFWNADGKPANARVPDVVSRLQTVLAREPDHLQANHLLIHALEESPHPEGALESANRLARDTFEPAAEHLAHMPAHTFMRIGDYHGAGLANTRALDLFDTLLASNHAKGHEGYRGHDCAFAVIAYMMSGEETAALHDARRCGEAATSLSDEVAVRFHHYDDLAARHDAAPFAHGMALAAEGKLKDAQAEVRTLDQEKDDVANVAAAVVRAAIARSRNDVSGEVSALERGVKLQDGLGYSEPPRFYYPVRESLGGALLRAGRVRDAESAFRADLVRNPGNPRSLYGLEAALEKTGKLEEASRVKAAFAQAWRYAAEPLDIDDL